MRTGLFGREVMAGLIVEYPIQAYTIRRPTIGLRSMIIRFSSISRILAVLFLLVAVIPAQKEEGDMSAGQLKMMRNQRRAAGDKAMDEKGDEMARQARWAAMTPEERLNSNIRRGSKGQCTFVATCRPPKLLPGQSGVMMITAILRGEAVLPAPSQVKMTARVLPRKVTFGSLNARPALPGTIAAAYLGRPVYENTAVFEVPVTMGMDVKLGDKTKIAVDLQFDIYHGGTGQVVGRFIERVATEVEAAPYVNPPITNRTPKAQPKPVKAAPIEVASTVANTIESDSNAMSGTAADIPVGGPEPVEVEEPTASSELPPTDSGDGIGLRYTLIIGGGAFLLVIVILLMRKK